MSNLEDEVVNLYSDGNSMAQIGKMLHISRKDVSQILHEKGVTIRKGGNTKADKNAKSEEVAEEDKDFLRIQERLNSLSFEVSFNDEKKFLMDEFDNFANQNIKECGCECISEVNMQRLYLAYAGFYVEAKKEFLPYTTFVNLFIMRYVEKYSADRGYSAYFLYKLNLRVRGIQFCMRGPLVRYYIGIARESVLVQHGREFGWTKAEMDSISAAFNTVGAREFDKKYSKAFVCGDLYATDFSGEAFPVVTESTVENTEGESEEQTLDKSETDCIVEIEDAELIIANTSTDFTSFRNKFQPEEYIPRVVSTVLCDDRHDVDAVTDTSEFSEPIFRPLTKEQMSNFQWMESVTDKWIKHNIKFNADGKAEQEVRIYTTGFNALNACAVKACYDNHVNLYNMYYDKTRNVYHEHKLINDFTPENDDFEQFKDCNIYRVSEYKRAKKTYAFYVDTTNGSNTVKHVFLTNSIKEAISWTKRISAEFMKIPFVSSLVSYRNAEDAGETLWSMQCSQVMIQMGE